MNSLPAAHRHSELVGRDSLETMLLVLVKATSPYSAHTSDYKPYNQRADKTALSSSSVI